MEGSLGTYVYQSLNSLLINIHVSCCRNPTRDQVDDIWNENKESLMKLSELAFSRIYGKVTDINSVTISNLVIKFVGNDFFAKVSENSGFYQKYLTPNTYEAVIDNHPLEVARQKFVINGKSPIRHDFLLSEKPKYTHHKYNDLLKQLKDLNKQYPKITNLKSIGKSVEGREILILEITSDVAANKTSKPQFAYISGKYVLFH